MFDLEHEANIKKLEELAELFRKQADFRSQVLTVSSGGANGTTRDTYQDAIAEFAETAVKIVKRLDQKSVIGF